MRQKHKKSPLHVKWHKIVEGQIKSCIHDHSEWFNEQHANKIINSLAKRIVGEIVADSRKLAPIQKSLHGRVDASVKSIT